MFVYELSGCGFEFSCSHLYFKFRACFEQGIPWDSVTIECGFTLKRVRHMIRTYSKMQRTDKYSQHSSIIWSVWLNSWVFVLWTKWLWVLVQLQLINLGIKHLRALIGPHMFSSKAICHKRDVTCLRNLRQWKGSTGKELEHKLIGLVDQNMTCSLRCMMNKSLSVSCDYAQKFTSEH